jgi:hypothetical protein
LKVVTVVCSAGDGERIFCDRLGPEVFSHEHFEAAADLAAGPAAPRCSARRGPGTGGRGCWRRPRAFAICSIGTSAPMRMNRVLAASMICSHL